MSKSQNSLFPLHPQDALAAVCYVGIGYTAQAKGPPVKTYSGKRICLGWNDDLIFKQRTQPI